eukprot:365630-Chlamydomonas_euryale.AAC.37
MGAWIPGCALPPHARPSAYVNWAVAVPTCPTTRTSLGLCEPGCGCASRMPNQTCSFANPMADQTCANRIPNLCQPRACALERRSSVASRCAWSRARALPSWGPAAAANPPSSSCSRASTTCRAAVSSSTAWRSAT